MLPEELRSRIAQEFRFAVDKMRDSEDLNKKLFYLSALYAELQRDSNVYWDRELAVLRLVIEINYQLINTRVKQLAGGDVLVPLDEKFFPLLAQAVDELATYFEEGKDDKANLFELAGRINELGHLTTGNGHYLFEKGVIKL
jgi:hypothetical protein